MTGIETYNLRTGDRATVIIPGDVVEVGFVVYTLRRIYWWLGLGQWWPKLTVMFDLGLRGPKLAGGDLRQPKARACARV